jgi:hypothetical protein
MQTKRQKQNQLKISAMGKIKNRYEVRNRPMLRNIFYNKQGLMM